MFSTTEKIPAIQLQIAEIASASPAPASVRSPAHRLRSKRSRLRLQNKERESDTDYSQEKESLVEGKSGSAEVKAKLLFPCKVEKNQDLPKKGKTDEKIAKEPQKLKVSKKTEVNCESANKPLVLGDEHNMAFQTVNICQKQPSPVGRPTEKLQSRTAANLNPIQTSSLPTSSESVSTDKSDGMLPPDSNKDTKHFSVMSGSLDSCTLVEGLPFPVEYYIRTTRRMAASQSSVNLEAVIQSQLSGGRGRRKLNQSQIRGRDHVSSELSESVCRSTNQAGRRGKGQRRRGRRRSIVRNPCSKAASDCISLPAGDSQTDSSVLIESKSTSQSTCQSELEERPQAESQPIPSPGPTANSNPSKEEEVTQDFKHLPDSQLYFESKLLPDSNLYPIFRRGRGLQTGEYSSQTCMSKDGKISYQSK